MKRLATLPAKLTKQQIEKLIRNHLSGTARWTTYNDMFHIINNFKPLALNKWDFDAVWDNLIKEGYLKLIPNKGYVWEM